LSVDNLFARGARMVHEEAVELTIASYRAYWDRARHYALAWSGGKDSTATLTLLIHLIDAGEIPRPECLHVFYADTRLEMGPIQAAALALIGKLRQRNWIKVHTVCAPMDKRFMVYMLGRGVPPPNNNTLRWWPMVDADDWCGSHAEKPKPAPDPNHTGQPDCNCFDCIPF